MEIEISTTILPTEDELKRLFTQTTWATKRDSKDINRLLQNLNIFVVIRHDSKVIGFGRAISDGAYRALIEDIIVDIAYRGKGYGKLIMENLMNQLDEIEEVFLNTNPSLEEFYHKFGFEKSDTFSMKKQHKERSFR